MLSLKVTGLTLFFDVEQAAKAQGLYLDNSDDKNNPHEIIRLTSMRKTIAKRLTEANRDIPHFYLRCKINMDNLIKSRRANKQGSINDYILKACAVALRAEPDVNVNFMGESIHRFKHADISVAVATDRGLITPIIRSADDKTISEISNEMKELAQKAKNESLQPSLHANRNVHKSAEYPFSPWFLSIFPRLC